MNEVLGKRLLGACVLVGATIVLANLLPSPQAVPPPEEHAKRVTYDLRPVPEVAKIEPPPAPAAEPAAPVQPAIEPQAPPAHPVVQAPPKPTVAIAPKPKAPVAKPVAPPKKKIEPVSPPVQTAEAAPVEASPSEAAPRASEPAPPATEPAPPKAGWYLQIGAFAHEANAKNSVAKLTHAGLQPREDTITMKAGKRFRVRCGPFASQQEAEQSKAKAVAIGFGDARISRD